MPTKGSLLAALLGVHENEVTGLEMTEFVPEANSWTTSHSRFRLMDRGWLSRLRLRLYAPFFRRVLARNVERLTTLLEDQYPAAQTAAGD